MKGTISPLLREILSNPDTNRAFCNGFFNRDRSQSSNEIDLGDGRTVTVKNFGFGETKQRKKRNLLDILLGK